MFFSNCREIFGDDLYAANWLGEEEIYKVDWRVWKDFRNRKRVGFTLKGWAIWEFKAENSV